MKTRKEIEDRIKLFMTNIRKGYSYDANVIMLANDIESLIEEERKKLAQKIANEPTGDE